MLFFFILSTESAAERHHIHWVLFAYGFLKELRRPRSASPLSGMCTSLLFTVFLPLQFGRSFHRNSRLSVQLPWGRPSLPPSLTAVAFSMVWAGPGPSLAATVAAVGPALPQFSIKTPNLNGAFKPRPAPLRPLPLIPPCSDSAFFFDFLPACECNGPLQDEILAQTLTAGSEESNQLRKLD